MEVIEVGAPLVVGYIDFRLAIGFHFGAKIYLVLRSHAFISRVDIAFVIHACTLMVRLKLGGAHDSMVKVNI